MGWSVKYVRSTSIYSLVDVGTRTPVTTKVLYGDTPGSYSFVQLTQYAKDLDAWTPFPIITNSEFTYSNEGFKWNGDPRFSPSVLRGAIGIFQDFAEASTVIAATINGRQVSNLFGWSSYSGGSLVPVATAGIVSLQGHDSQQSAAHVVVYAYPQTNGRFMVGAFIGDDSGLATNYSHIFQYGGASTADIARCDEFLSDLTDIAPNDPYMGAGYPASNAPGGLSGGSFNFTDNGLTAMHTPGIDLLGSGFFTAWNVNKAQLNALANWLWVTTPSQIFQQIYGNPINAVIGLNVVPVAPSVDSGSNTIKFGPEDSGVAAPKITSQYVSVDCGTLTIRPTYGSYMDYGPYSSAELFLPYCGGVPLDINDVVGKTISVKYQVDILSGACVAYIFIDGHLHYQKSGCCAGTAPVTGSQMPNVISGVLSIVGSVAGAIGSLGASGASTAAKVASGIATGTNVADAATNALKRSISYSGTVSGWAGLLGAQKPYLILTLPNAAIPAGQQQLAGYPAWVGGQLSNFSGHTECASVHLNGLRATDEEMQEIRSLLESGVIL